MGILYIVPTPIGNLEDITLRALRVLREASLIAAEDTRVSRVLTRHFDIEGPLTSYHEHNKLGKLDEILRALQAGDVALISDAGTPGISDPGGDLIRAAIERGHEVVPLPGACAITTALVGSGLAADRFLFVGFLPRKRRALQDELGRLATRQETIVAYESPYRLPGTLALIAQVMGGERKICVARELSKRYERFYRGAASELQAHFSREQPKGEVTLVISGAPTETATWSADRVKMALRERLEAGESLSSAARAIARRAGWKKNDVYQLGIGQE